LELVWERFRFWCSLWVLERLILLSAPVDVLRQRNVTYSVSTEAELGLVQSKATKHVVLQHGSG
jgi:hypothetical protein